MERAEYNGIQNKGGSKEMDRFGKWLEGKDPKTRKSHSDVYRAQFDNIHATA
ncbi:hypothetical protein [Corallococcus sp. EGB]|uniref:hypothetical protein n=1 Tax=Corallococcus sp. EGB TaxID=1521117 RepID=UPI001CBBDE9F|nr:hypothetical protein [Corallococcus sp. EGB]